MLFLSICHLYVHNRNNILELRNRRLGSWLYNFNIISSKRIISQSNPHNICLNNNIGIIYIYIYIYMVFYQNKDLHVLLLH